MMCDSEKLMFTFSEAEKFNKEGSSSVAYTLFSKFLDDASKCVKGMPNNEESKNLQKNIALGYNNRGFIRYNRVDFDEAIEDYTNALKFDQSLYFTYYNRGLIHYRLGRFDAAITDMTKAIEIQPDFKPAQECLAQANVDKLAKVSKDNES